MKKTMRIAFAQMNPTVGDFAGNTKKIISWIQKAEKEKAELIVFPEMAVCGYPVWDLANKRSFIDESLKSLEKIIHATKSKKVAVAIGYIDSDKSRKVSYNALGWIERGKLKAKQYKRLLPTYDVFLENIFFRPGQESRAISWKKWKVAPTVCEDIWDEGYDVQPLQELKKQGANLGLNISASPFFQGVEKKRDSLVCRHAIRKKMPMIYVNQVGAQDDLIFDGRSFLVNAKGAVLFRCPAFEEGLFFYDWNTSERASKSVQRLYRDNDPGEAHEAVILGIRDYCRKNGFKKALLGLSGGIDSAVVAALATEALGAKNVMGITMPGKYSSKGSWKHSEELSENLGIQCYTHPIDANYEFLMKQYRKNLKKHKTGALKAGKVTLAMENLQARLRGMELMFLSNHEGRILLTTGNKSELAVGYCTLYGDMAGGLAVLGDVYKTDVYRLARYCNRNGEVIPESIINKAPSAELRPDQKDEDSLPPYDVLDKILYLYIEKNQSKKEVVAEMKLRRVSAKVVEDIIRKTDHNEYKRRQTPPILRITEKAWFGRRMPITNQFDR